jgi:hypothetical protein
MTRRAAVIARRAGSGPLPVSHEVPAAGYVRPWWRVVGMNTRRFWESIEHTHGPAIRDKVREATPGCRPGFMYGAGRLPPLPLIEEPPPTHAASTEYIDIDGVRYWYCRSYGDHEWLPCQAEHLRAAGEIDGREWRDYLRWRDEGFPARYRLAGGNRTIIGLHHLCY